MLSAIFFCFVVTVFVLVHLLQLFAEIHNKMSKYIDAIVLRYAVVVDVVIAAAFSSGKHANLIFPSKC